MLGLHRDGCHHGQARAMPCPVHQVLHIAGGTLEDGFDPAVVQVAHPPGHTALPGHPLTGSAEVDTLDQTGDQHPIADHMLTLRCPAAADARVSWKAGRVTAELLHEPVEGEWSFIGLESFPVRRCLQAILSEEWEHRLYDERDFDLLLARPD